LELHDSFVALSARFAAIENLARIQPFAHWQESTIKLNEDMLSKSKLGLLIAVILSFAVSAFAQGCPLCYTQAASSGTRFVAGLRSGIMVLIVPSLFMSAGIVWVAYRKRNQFRSDFEEGIHLADSDSNGE
jgi:hypothetical protein